MSQPETFQIPLETAETYESRFVPAIFADWSMPVIEAAGIGPGTRVLDVACGTGIVARTAAPLVGADGQVVGVDLNPAMLAVAERVAPTVEWRQGPADELPVETGSFDVVTCQMAMMFFPDRRAALVEMARAVGPGGRVVVMVPAGLADQPAYGPFVEAVVDRAGDWTRSLVEAYWNCGDLDELSEVVADAGLEVVDRRTRVGTARFASASDFVLTEIEATPLAGRVDADTVAAIVGDVGTALARIAVPEGPFEIPLVGHIIVARSAGG